MTIDRVAMKELLEKGSDQDLLREMLAFVAARMMDVEVESLTGAAHGERSPERTNQRNGYRTREWHTGVGTVPVAIPKLRKSTYFPSFLEPRRSADKAMIAVIQEAYVHGVSTRSVDDLGQGDGHDRHLQEPGVAALRGDRRPRQGVPQPADRRLLALRVDRRHLREGA